MVQNKVIVFDLDKTIGYFTQFSTLIYCIEKIKKRFLSKKEQHKLLDLFPEYFRTGIFPIFNYLKQEKQNHAKNKIKVLIYTNNNGHKSWTHMIKQYIERQINYKLFDRVICAWKVDNVLNEKKRTTYEKTYSDLKRCANLSKKDRIIFLDDLFHPQMKHPKIKYLFLDEYIYKFNINTIINRLLQLKKPILKNKRSLLFLKMCLNKNIRTKYDGRIIKKRKLHYNILNEIKFFIHKKYTIKTNKHEKHDKLQKRIKTYKKHIVYQGHKAPRTHKKYKTHKNIKQQRNTRKTTRKNYNQPHE